ncbi:MAG: hypothetical protein ABR575_10310 [Actinomycetota bacterium]
MQIDTTPARWIEQSLARQPWATVGALVPDRFEAYARILYPAYRTTMGRPIEPVRWSDIAARNGRVLHPQVAFARIADLGDDPNEQPTWGRRPQEGDLPSEVIGPLKRVLGAATTTPERCWFCVWRGEGAMPYLEGYDDIPAVRTPGRDYNLVSGTLDAVALFDDHTPNIWWPEDRSWCVASEVDLDSTYVGGSAECIERLAEERALEVLMVTPGDRVDVAADDIDR